MPSRPPSPALLGHEIASRIKARFSRSRRRSSRAPSLASSRSDAEGIITAPPSQLPHDFSTVSEPPRATSATLDDANSGSFASSIRTSNERRPSDEKIARRTSVSGSEMQVLPEEPESAHKDLESQHWPQSQSQPRPAAENTTEHATEPATKPAVENGEPGTGFNASSSLLSADPSDRQPTAPAPAPAPGPSLGPSPGLAPATAPGSTNISRQESTTSTLTATSTNTSTSNLTETPEEELLAALSQSQPRIRFHDAPRSEPANSNNNNTSSLHRAAAVAAAAGTLRPESPGHYYYPPQSRSRSQAPDPPHPSSPSSTSSFPPPSDSNHLAHPTAPVRRQSLLPTRQAVLIETLLQQDRPSSSRSAASDAYGSAILPIDDAMSTTRKIWVKRPGASSTLVVINEDDLVDDVRDLILRKYSNSLGRSFDSPDLTLHILSREQHHSHRLLGPEEHMARVIDAYYPGGQTVDEALVIDIPHRRTPKPSPRVPFAPHTVAAAAAAYHAADEARPPENGEGYFPPVGGVPSPHLPLSLPAPTNGTVAASHSIAVLGTGQIPPIPSPGRTSRAYRDRPERPRLGRTHTSSPTVLANGHPAAAAMVAASHDVPGLPPTAPPLPSPPVPEPILTRAATPPPRIASPRPAARAKKSKKLEHPAPNPSMLVGVPPISVLIVEDNPINLKLLEAFIKRLKVRWQTAMNGRDAVRKWRTGGFHLVLMDIQLPVMNGLEATREIRRLERVNSIGVFSLAASTPEDSAEELQDKDRLENISMFKSPVIIVALTASSLQSDRHEALAAGCNDFLTKPVDFDWLKRKVMEWGCMQALIDFDGWRKWKDISNQAQEDEAAKKTLASKAKKKNRSSLTSSGGTT